MIVLTSLFANILLSAEPKQSKREPIDSILDFGGQGEMVAFGGSIFEFF